MNLMKNTKIRSMVRFLPILRKVLPNLRKVRRKVLRKVLRKAMG